MYVFYAQIMKQFSVAPFDQTLTVDGVVLSDDTATLKSLKVSPGAIVMLQVTLNRISATNLHEYTYIMYLIHVY